MGSRRNRGFAKAGGSRYDTDNPPLGLGQIYRLNAGGQDLATFRFGFVDIPRFTQPSKCRRRIISLLAVRGVYLYMLIPCVAGMLQMSDTPSRPRTLEIISGYAVDQGWRG